MPVQVGIFLFLHKADPEGLGPCGRVFDFIRCKRAPFTVFATGKTLETIRDSHPLIADVIKTGFSRNAGAHDPYSPEIGISCHQQFPLVPMRLDLQHWGTYLTMSDEQVRWSKEILWNSFGINARGIFPPECIMAPAAANVVRSNGLDYSIFNPPLEFGGHEKGMIYGAQGLKFVPRDSDIQPQNPPDADFTHSQIKWCGRDRLIIGWDLNSYEWCGNVENALNFLERLADLIRNDPDLELVNIASIADNYHEPKNLQRAYQEKGFEDPHRFITSWIDASNALDFLAFPPSGEKNRAINDFVRYFGYLYQKLGFNWREDINGWLQDTKNNWYGVSGMEFRHPGWTRGLDAMFWDRQNWCMDELRKIDQNLG